MDSRISGGEDSLTLISKSSTSLSHVVESKNELTPKMMVSSPRVVDQKPSQSDNVEDHCDVSLCRIHIGDRQAKRTYVPVPCSSSHSQPHTSPLSNPSSIQKTATKCNNSKTKTTRIKGTFDNTKIMKQHKMSSISMARKPINSTSAKGEHPLPKFTSHSSASTPEVETCSPTTKNGRPNGEANSNETAVDETLLTREQISKYFNVPIKEAAQHIGISLTQFKRICRDRDIPRWPYRKLQSLKSKINEKDIIRKRLKEQIREVTTSSVKNVKRNGHEQHVNEGERHDKQDVNGDCADHSSCDKGDVHCSSSAAHQEHMTSKNKNDPKLLRDHGKHEEQSQPQCRPSPKQLLMQLNEVEKELRRLTEQVTSIMHNPTALNTGSSLPNSQNIPRNSSISFSTLEFTKPQQPSKHSTSKKEQHPYHNYTFVHVPSSHNHKMGNRPKYDTSSQITQSKFGDKWYMESGNSQTTSSKSFDVPDSTPSGKSKHDASLVISSCEKVHGSSSNVSTQLALPKSSNSFGRHVPSRGSHDDWNLNSSNVSSRNSGIRVHSPGSNGSRYQMSEEFIYGGNSGNQSTQSPKSHVVFNGDGKTCQFDPACKDPKSQEVPPSQSLLSSTQRNGNLGHVSSQQNMAKIQNQGPRTLPSIHHIHLDLQYQNQKQDHHHHYHNNNNNNNYYRPTSVSPSQVLERPDDSYGNSSYSSTAVATNGTFQQEIAVSTRNVSYLSPSVPPTSHDSSTILSNVRDISQHMTPEASSEMEIPSKGLHSLGIYQNAKSSRFQKMHCTDKKDFHEGFQFSQGVRTAEQPHPQNATNFRTLPSISEVLRTRPGETHHRTMGEFSSVSPLPPISSNMEEC